MPRQRVALSKDKIIDAAITLVEVGGAEGFSIRKLATAMGVVPMAFYNHFEDRDALLDAVAEYVLHSLVPLPVKEPWRLRLAALFRGVQNLRVEHPQAFRLAMSRPTNAATIANLMGLIIQSLRDAGLREREAVTCYHTLVMFLHGFPIWEAGMISECTPRLPGKRGGDRAVLKRVHSVQPDKQFDASITWLLDSVEALAQRERSA
ncbi:MAG: TetR family transcriptional regulator [Rhizobiales bacterium]|nr:TetR family transcriptional regulator [Hyphomicrobiales bacterium]